jgi:hypothetical protein
MFRAIVAAGLLLGGGQAPPADPLWGDHFVAFLRRYVPAR